jgi:hypothetical protein
MILREETKRCKKEWDLREKKNGRKEKERG